MGLSCAREKRLEEGIPFLEQASRRAPENPYVWRALGDTLRLSHERLSEAEAAILKAVELQLEDPMGWLGRSARIAGQDRRIYRSAEAQLSAQPT